MWDWNLNHEAPHVWWVSIGCRNYWFCQIPMHKSLNDALSNPEACNIAIIRSCGKPSNALDRSVSNAT